MQTQELKITKIGNSLGIRIPSGVLQRYAFKDALIMVESVDGVMLRPKQQTDVKMSWADTAKDMMALTENWSEWETVSADGLAAIPWETEGAEGKQGKKLRKRRHETL